LVRVTRIEDGELAPIFDDEPVDELGTQPIDPVCNFAGHWVPPEFHHEPYAYAAPDGSSSRNYRQSSEDSIVALFVDVHVGQIVIQLAEGQ
jgi:hypothetical protein